MKYQSKAFVAMALCIAVFIISCQKEITVQQQNMGGLTQNEPLSALYNPFGVFITASASNQNVSSTSDPSKQYELTYGNKIKLAKDYGVKYIRQQIYKEKWDDPAGRSGFLANFSSVTSNGFKVLLNVMGYPLDGKVYPFPDAKTYGNLLKNILDSLNARHLRPELIVVENEETNDVYHTIDHSSQTAANTSMQKYVDELTTAVNICKAYVWWDGKVGVKVTNGGFTTREITYSTWYWLYNTKKDTAAARVYALNGFSPVTYKNIYNSIKFNGVPPAYVMNSINTDEFLRTKYEPLGLSFINIHWYEPVKARGWNETAEGGSPWSKGISPDSTSKNVLETSTSYFTAMFTPKIISNAVGQLTTSSVLTNEICNKILKQQSGSFYYASWFDGDGKYAYDAKAFHNTFMNNGVDSYSMRSSGTVYKQINASRNQQTGAQ